jgi:hypothetical protein
MLSIYLKVLDYGAWLVPFTGFMFVKLLSKIKYKERRKARQGRVSPSFYYYIKSFIVIRLWLVLYLVDSFNSYFYSLPAPVTDTVNSPGKGV